MALFYYKTFYFSNKQFIKYFNYYNNCSQVNWSNIGKYLNSISKEVVLAEADGFCFLNVVSIGLYLDHVPDRDHMGDAILAELMQNESTEFYSLQNLFQDLLNFTRHGVY